MTTFGIIEYYEEGRKMCGHWSLTVAEFLWEENEARNVGWGFILQPLPWTDVHTDSVSHTGVPKVSKTHALLTF